MKLIENAATWLLLLMVAACSTTTPTSGTDTPAVHQVDPFSTAGTVQVVHEDDPWKGFCAVAKAITWSKRDTAETVVEIKQHNHLGAVHCGWPE